MKTLLDELEDIDMALVEGDATPEQENRGQELVTLANAAPAQALLLDLLRHDIVTITDGEVGFDDIVFAYDSRSPDWHALVEAMGWDKTRAAIAKAAGGSYEPAY